MSSNIYFQNSMMDQNLMDDINREVIQQAGFDGYYIPRTIVKEDFLYGEDVLSKFTNVYQVEMFVKSIEGFGGEGDLVSKFGLDVKDELIITVHKKHFQIATEMDKPLEGDLIYFPQNKGVFEIKFVEHEQPFYVVGKNYTYDLTCELFQYSEEQMDTGVEEVDDIEREQSYAVDLIVSSGGTGTFIVDEEVYQGANLATATAKGIVVSWTPSAGNPTIRVNDLVGTFIAGTNITGESSGAIWSLASSDTLAMPTTPFADNTEFETDADSILDFSESNPFGEVT